VKRKRRTSELGEMQAVAYVRIGGYPTAAMANTGSPRSVVGREIAERACGKPTGGPPAHMNIAGHRLTGTIVEFEVEMIECPGRATVKAFVPDAGQKFAKGVLLGMDFLQPAGLHIDAATGEAYCPEKKGVRK